MDTKRSLVHTFTSQPFSAQVTLDPETRVKKRLAIGSPEYYQTYLNKIPVGTPVTLIITNKKPKRTDQQNRFYWGVYLPAIARETGENDLERLHQLFKGKFLTEWTGNVLGCPVRVTRSTTNLSVIEFSEFITNIHALTNVEPPPVEDWGLAPLNLK